jgi:hypothetical protein
MIALCFPTSKSRVSAIASFFLPVLRLGFRPDGSRNKQLWGLVLKAAEPENHEYTRIGSFRIVGLGRIAEFLQVVATEITGKHEHDLAKSMGIDGDGRTLYSIKIV